jgi:hypothetical protein
VITAAQRNAILDRISPARITALTAELGAVDRTPGGRGLDQVYEQLAAALGQAGAEQVELKSYPFGPEHRYFGWSEERCPFTELAELWLRLPEGGEVLLCRSTDDPRCTMGALRSTSPEGEIFEVVDVGFGTRATDYRSHRMSGKVALASGHHVHAAMLEALAVRQAEGLLCGPGDLSPEGRSEDGVPRRLGDPSLFGRHRPFGFNLNAAQYNTLANRLAAGEEVHVRVRTRVRLDTGELPVLRARRDGSDLAAERVLLIVELGASATPEAAACAQELLRAVCALIVEAQIIPLRRALELLVVPSLQALVAHLAEAHGQLDEVRAVLLFSVEPDREPRVTVHHAPASRPSFIADLAVEHVRGAGLAPQGAPYARGSLLAPLVDRELGLAGVWLRGRAATGARLRQLLAGLAATVVDLCTMQEDDLPRVIATCQLCGLERLATRASRLRDTIGEELAADRSSTTGRHLLWLIEEGLAAALRLEQETLRSCGEYLSGAGQQTLRLAEAAADLEQLVPSLQRSLHAEVAASLPRARLSVRRRPLSPLERRAQTVVAHRAFVGPPPLPTLLRDAAPTDREWLAHNLEALARQPVDELALQWVDGARSVLEIWDRLRIDDPRVELRLIWRYLEVLAEVGLLRLEEQPNVAAP